MSWNTKVSLGDVIPSGDVNERIDVITSISSNLNGHSSNALIHFPSSSLDTLYHPSGYGTFPYISANTISSNLITGPLATMIRNSQGGAWPAVVDNIQVAIDDLGTSGGTVFIPQGNYTVTTPIIIRRHGITIQGARGTTTTGHGTRLLMGANLPSGVIWISGTTVPFSFPWNTHICDLMIDGDDRQYTGIGINCNCAHFPIFERLNIWDISGIAIRHNNTRGPTLSDSVIKYCGVSGSEPTVYLYANFDKTTHPAFLNTYFELNYYCDIFAESDLSGSCVASTRGIVSNCYFEVYSGVVPDTSGVRWAIRPGSNWGINNNSFIGHAYHSWIYCSGSHSANARIANNNFSKGAAFSSNGNPTWSSGAQVYIQNAANCIVDGNYFNDSSYNAIHMAGNKTVIANNRFNLIASKGIDVQRTHCTIVGNSFENISTGYANREAIHLQGGADYATVVGNIIYSSARGIRITAGCVSSSIIGNIITDVYDGDAWRIYEANADGVNTIKNNPGIYDSLWPYISTNNLNFTNGRGTELILAPTDHDYGTYNFQVSGPSIFSGAVEFIGELSGLADPTYNSGAANKHYVDITAYPSSLGNSISGSYYGHSSNADIHYPSSQFTSWLDNVYAQSGITSDASSQVTLASGLSSVDTIWHDGIATTMYIDMPLSSLSDVSSQTPASGQSLVWNGSIWIASTVSGQGAGDLSDLIIDADKDWGGTYGIHNIAYFSANTFQVGTSGQTISEIRKGWATVSDEGTIPHGCSSEPSWVTIAPSGATPILFSFIKDDTNITVYHSDEGSRYFSWQAMV
jgi:hypothetical protein